MTSQADSILKILHDARKLADGATEGKWEHDMNGYIAVADSDGEWGSTLLMTPGSPSAQDLANADYAAHAAALLPRMVEAMEVLVIDEHTGEELFKEWCGNSYEWNALLDVEHQRWNRLADKSNKRLARAHSILTGGEGKV